LALVFIRVESREILKKKDILMQLPVGFGLKIYSPFLTTYIPFSGEAHFLSLLVLKDLQPSRGEKSK